MGCDSGAKGDHLDRLVAGSGAFIRCPFPAVNQPNIAAPARFPARANTPSEPRLFLRRFT